MFDQLVQVLKDFPETWTPRLPNLIVVLTTMKRKLCMMLSEVLAVNFRSCFVSTLNTKIRSVSEILEDRDLGSLANRIRAGG